MATIGEVLITLSVVGGILAMVYIGFRLFFDTSELD